MKTSIKAIKLLEHFEGIKLKPYLCSAGKPTIGIGMTFYPETNQKVTLQDKPLPSVAEAYRQLGLILVPFEKQVVTLTRGVTLKQHQFDALVCFQFNTGSLIRRSIDGNVIQSGLLKKVKANSNDKTIWGEFLLWDKVRADRDGKDNDKDGIVDEPGEMKSEFGLVRRANAQAHLYFLNELNFYEQLKA